jgi:Glycosyltransferase family 10 (fucosyltransferase) C-term
VVKLVDGNFAHHTLSRLSCDQQYYDALAWDRGSISPDDTVVFTDGALSMVDSRLSTKIGWLIESKLIAPHAYEWMAKNHDRFDHVWTHDRELLEGNPKCRFVPVGGAWIFEKDQRMHDKSKLLSIIASEKTATPGHKLRHAIVATYGGRIDGLFGRAYQAIPYKADGLRDYMFTFAIENARYDYYFTEKLIDCFVTGTIPIYWGCPSIGRFFDVEGIIVIEGIEDIDRIIGELASGLYEKMKKHATTNFALAKDYLLSEQTIVRNNYV